MKWKKLKNKKILLIAVIVVGIIIGAGLAFAVRNNSSADTNQGASDQTALQDEALQNNEQTTEEKPKEEPTTPTPVTTTPPDANTSQYPVQLTSSEAASLTVVVNKKHKLPSTYAPTLGPSSRLRTEAETAFNSMLSAAKSSGAPSMKYVSGYRSYSKQEQLYNGYVASDGRAAADTYSARPGFSEHQTGLAVDIGEGSGCDLETCFENTASGKWAAANAYKYGFIVRYQKGKDAITGYQYEPWHLRYLGISEATAVYNSGKTLEEYYGIPGGTY
jgi:D-alanyl-D-alanine carboxypeptidase